MEYEIAHNRKPLPGDILTFTDIKPSIKAEDVDEWRQVWDRRVPEYPFPYKWGSGHLFLRVADYVVRQMREMGRQTLRYWTNGRQVGN